MVGGCQVSDEVSKTCFIGRLAYAFGVGLSGTASASDISGGFTCWTVACSFSSSFDRAAALVADSLASRRYRTRSRSAVKLCFAKKRSGEEIKITRPTLG